ncbi:MAG: hypothetical protein H7282_04500 [Cytophagaceae bacterium]|nr:hypothetical protein [Cytophagaceae bacterium]
MNIDWAGLTIITGGILFFLTVVLCVMIQIRKARKPKFILSDTYRREPANWEERLQEVEEKFGTDALSLIYTIDSKKNLDSIENAYFKGELNVSFLAGFHDKSRFNFPGPFYTGYTDNCGTGQPTAPSTILYDENGHEHILKQPRTTKQLIELLVAAYIDPFGAYAIDGNNHWTIDLIKEWWQNKSALIAELSTENIIQNQDGTQAQDYIDYLNGEALLDLRKYAFFLLHKKYPTAKEFNELPEIH